MTIQIPHYNNVCHCLCLNQDILENESINLDWMFRYSLINDIVKVRVRQTAGSRIEEQSTFFAFKSV